MKQSNKLKALLLLIYFLIVCLFFEGISWILVSIDSFFYKIGDRNNPSWRLKWIKRHQHSKNTKVYYYTFDLFDSTKGWALTPNLRNITVFDGKILNSNSRGIRGNMEYSYNKLPGQNRILILGDSFTFGDQVSDNETYPYYLQQMLPNTEVINFGIHGYGHDQMLLYLKEEGIKYSPDVVILGFVGDDMNRNLLEFRDYSKPKFELVHNKLQIKNYPVPPPDLTLKNEIYRSKFIDLLTIFYNDLLWKFGINEERKNEITIAIVDEMIERISSIGATPVIFYLPTPHEINDLDDKIIPEEEFLNRYCRERIIHCFSLRSSFLASVKEEINFKPPGHWNPRGNLLISHRLKEYLLDKNLINKSQ